MKSPWGLIPTRMVTVKKAENVTSVDENVEKFEYLYVGEGI